MSAPTWGDLVAFCKADQWNLSRQTKHAVYRKVLADGTALLPYNGPPLTVGNELNKLAANVAQGRNALGIHYRSDYWESLKLGETVALGILQDQKNTFEEAATWTITKFELGRRTTGSSPLISAGCRNLRSPSPPSTWRCVVRRSSPGRLSIEGRGRWIC